MNTFEQTMDYSDIIDLPHHVSKNHMQMPMMARAAQFAPFAALTGHGAAIEETARITDNKITLSEDENKRLNIKLNSIITSTTGKPIATFTYFIQDERKEGGRYATFTGRIKCIDDYEQIIHFDDGTTIPITNVVDIVEET